MQREARERTMQAHFIRVEHVPLHPPALHDAYRAGFDAGCKYKDSLAASASELLFARSR